MSFFDVFRKRRTEPFNDRPTFEFSYGSGEIAELTASIRGLSPQKLWETQHNVRTVVDFLARNIGQLGLHAYQRESDGGRVRVRDTPVTRLLAAPNRQMTTYDLVVSLISDLALFDQAWWLVVSVDGGHEVRPLPVDRVSIVSGSEFSGNLKISVRLSADEEPTIIDQDRLIHFRGWDPAYGRRVSPAVATLRDVLAEQIAAQRFRLNVWENGGQISQYIHRPKDAPDWSPEARNHFTKSMEEYRADGGRSGKMPLMADGMEIRQTRFNAKEEQWAEAQQLALETVARAWHINPAMLGATGGVSYANVKEFRKMLYGETLGPWLRMVQDRLNRFLLPMVGEAPGTYVEFNVKSKLAASFDEQAQVLSSAVGRPWMTANEARALENMPALDGDADSLVTPLNVLTGGQASPRDSGEQNRRSGHVRGVKAPAVRFKAEGREEDALLCEQVLQKYFKRQGAAVLTRLGAKSPAWWDQERWDKELSDDLFKAATTVSGDVAVATLEALGIDPDGYDADRTLAFLKSMAGSRAKWINETTLRQLEAALDDDLDEDAEKSTPEGVFEEAQGSRSELAGVTLATALAGFAATEALKQTGSPGNEKTWVVTSGNPRASHAAMGGETVLVSDDFSNGMKWPGDMPGAGYDAAEIANCSCVVEFTVY